MATKKTQLKSAKKANKIVALTTLVKLPHK